MIQSETPYWQPGPPAPAPFVPNSLFTDPTYSHCAPGNIRCPLSYAVIARQSSYVYIYGAGLYNFFNSETFLKFIILWIWTSRWQEQHLTILYENFSDYDQTCLDTEDCQYHMVSLANNNQFYMFNVNTKAAVNMVVYDTQTPLAQAANNVNGFCRTINAFTAQV